MTRDGPTIEIEGAELFIRDVWRLLDDAMPRELEKVWSGMRASVEEPIREATPVGPDKHDRDGKVVHKGGKLKRSFKYTVSTNRVAWSYAAVPYGMRRHWGYRSKNRRLPEFTRKQRFEQTVGERSARETHHRSLRWEPWAWLILKEHEPLFHKLLLRAWETAQRRAGWPRASDV